jgi:hypothetical protein
MMGDGWYPTRWWRVIASDGSLWGESSDRQEMEEAMRPGDTLQLLWGRQDREWRDAECELDDQALRIAKMYRETEA